MLNTVVRQIAFYSFERKLHEERRQGELTAERIGELWLAVQARKPRAGDPARARLRDLLGLCPALHPLALLRLRLCVRRLPGELALRRLPASPEGFAERYLALLAAGGTQHHRSCCAPSASTRTTRSSGDRPRRDRGPDRRVGAPAGALKTLSRTTGEGEQAISSARVSQRLSSEKAGISTSRLAPVSSIMR